VSGRFFCRETSVGASIDAPMASIDADNGMV